MSTVINKKCCLFLVSPDYSDILLFSGCNGMNLIGMTMPLHGPCGPSQLGGFAQPKDVIVQNWMHMMYLEWQFLKKKHYQHCSSVFGL